MSTKPLFITLGIVVTLVFTGAILGWWFWQNHPASAPKAETAQNTNTNEKTVDPKEHNYIDVDFARKMIVHGQQGVQIADMAKNKATDDGVRQLANSISTELSNNSKQYSDWLTEWNETYYNLSDFPEMEGHDMYPTHPGMASLGDLNALESADGKSVDDLFLRLMIAHHEGVIEMEDGGYFNKMQFGEMISLRNETLKRQANEIQTMKQLQANGE